MTKSSSSNQSFIAMFLIAVFLLLPAQKAWPAWPFSKAEPESKKSGETAAQLPAMLTERKEEPAKIDTILTTLNEALEENKKFRTEVESAQDQIGKATIENNVLRSQLRTLQAQADTFKSQLDEKQKQSQEEMAELVSQIEKLKDAEKKSQEFSLAAAESALSTESENSRLKRLLETAILQSERDDYVRLIAESQSKAQNAAQKMMAAKRQNERMKAELGSAYYNLGNMLSDSGNHRGAITQYKKALRLNPNDAWSHYNLAIIYDYYLNNRVKSLAHYKKYLNLEPVKTELDKVRERVLEIELLDSVTPKAPLKADFNNYTKDLNKPYTLSNKT